MLPIITSTIHRKFNFTSLMQEVLSASGQGFSSLVWVRYVLFLGAFLSIQPAVKAQVFSNEIHYDNNLIDVNEKIEVAGPAGTNLSGWSIILYNGSGGGNTIPLRYPAQFLLSVR